jgi:hypothetical protein
MSKSEAMYVKREMVILVVVEATFDEGRNDGLALLALRRRQKPATITVLASQLVGAVILWIKILLLT